MELSVVYIDTCYHLTYDCREKEMLLLTVPCDQSPEEAAMELLTTFDCGASFPKDIPDGHILSVLTALCSRIDFSCATNIEEEPMFVYVALQWRRRGNEKD